MKKENIVNIIPRSKPQESKYIPYWLGASVLLLIVVAGGYFFINSQIQAKEREIEEIEGKLSLSRSAMKQRSEMKDISEKVKVFSDIFKEHRYSSEAIRFLKELCHPNVQFVSLYLNLKSFSHRAEISAETSDFNTLIEQIILLKENEFIENVKISTVSLNKEGKVNFEFSLNLSDKLVLKNKFNNKNNGN